MPEDVLDSIRSHLASRQIGNAELAFASILEYVEMIFDELIDMDLEPATSYVARE